MCQRSEKIMDLSSDQMNDGKINIVLQTNEVTLQTPSVTTTDANNETNGNRSPTTSLSMSSIILSPCSDNEIPNNGINNGTDEEFDEVKKFFDKKLHVIEKWLRERATPDIQSKLHDATETAPKSPKLRTASVTSDLFQQWLTSSPVQVCEYLKIDYINWFFHLTFCFSFYLKLLKITKEAIVKLSPVIDKPTIFGEFGRQRTVYGINS